MIRSNVIAKPNTQGFSLIEVLISIVILMVGLLTLAATFASALAATYSVQEDTIARQKASEALESIFTARQTQQITFAQIRNVSNGGIFQNGPQVLLQGGADGLVGTANDVNFPANGPCPAGPECIVLPGPDGTLGTPDDLPLSLSTFRRTIDIVDVGPNLRQITVTVTYNSPRPASYSTTALISSYR